MREANLAAKILMILKQTFCSVTQPSPINLLVWVSLPHLSSQSFQLLQKICCVGICWVWRERRILVASVLIDRGRLLVPTLVLIQAPLGPQRLLQDAARRELHLAELPGHARALPLWVKAGHQFRDQPAGFLGLQVANLLWDVDQRVNLFVMALLRTVLNDAAGSAHLHWNFFTTCVPHKLAWALL